MEKIHYRELYIDESDLDLSDYRVWVDASPSHPCSVLDILGSVSVDLTLQLSELEPDQENRIFIRVPIFL